MSKWPVRTAPAIWSRFSCQEGNHHCWTYSLAWVHSFWSLLNCLEFAFSSFQIGLEFILLPRDWSGISICFSGIEPNGIGGSGWNCRVLVAYSSFRLPLSLMWIGSQVLDASHQDALGHHGPDGGPRWQLLDPQRTLSSTLLWPQVIIAITRRSHPLLFLLLFFFVVLTFWLFLVCSSAPFFSLIVHHPAQPYHLFVLHSFPFPSFSFALLYPSPVP